MMTELEFLSRFRRQPDGVWACTKPININGPNGPVVIGQGAKPCLWGSISPRNSIKWPRSMALDRKHQRAA
jgi:hypothetical protein